jgi:hypothetical protein
MVRSPRRYLHIVTLSLIIVWCGRPTDGAAGERASEYAVKAAYLFNFARFVTWPPSAFADPSAPLMICILGIDPFGTALDAMIANETVEGHRLAARRLAEPEEIAGCQIVFVTASVDGAGIVRALHDRPILTVSDAEAFAEGGGMVGFRIEHSTVKITVNTDALRRGGLTMSSQVLRLARIVPGAS